jgi:DNA replicative helicase MCM subunit Mcm2 (Cdc46/Mcm family)
MPRIQCPACKQEFEIVMDVAIRTNKSIVFRGKIAFLGKLKDISQLLDFIQSTFKEQKRISKQALIKKLTDECDIPHNDACHFIDKLKKEGFMYEPANEELSFVN